MNATSLIVLVSLADPAYLVILLSLVVTVVKVNVLNCVLVSILIDVVENYGLNEADLIFVIVIMVAVAFPFFGNYCKLCSC